MPGLATRILIAKRVAAALKATGAPESSIIEANPQWYHFGALGPAIGEFVPFEPSNIIGVPHRTTYYTIWKQILEIAVGNTSTNTPGVVPVLRTFTQFLDKVTALVLARKFDELKAMRDSGQLAAVDQAGRDLAALLTTFSDQDKLSGIGKLMGNNSRPAILNGINKIPPEQWTGREWLHWKHPGTFAAELRDRAKRSGDPRFMAYALGWTVAYGSLVCGSSFMNSLVGGSYRNHWWRSRFIGNFVDTWVWGYYGADATMSSETDLPSPPYEEWPGLCNAKLNEMIDLTGGLNPEDVARQVVAEQPLPQVLPPEFVNFWLDAWRSTYAPRGGPSLFTADRLQVSYLMLWITLWFQTSGAVIGCNVQPNPTPPDACGDNPSPPDWVDPTQPNPATPGKTFVAPTPSAKHDPNIAEIVSGVVEALAGVAALFGGGFVVGAALVAEGIGLIVDGDKQLNWDELECHLYWLRWYLFNGLEALHTISVLGAMQHPYPRNLTHDTMQMSFNGKNLPSYLSGAAICKSRSMDGLHLPWDGTLSTWTFYPDYNGIEQPATDVWRIAGLWPSCIVDDSDANPGTADIARFPPSPLGGVDGSFGPAVWASIELIRSPGILPDWNLDGDRGRGWMTWELVGLYDSPPNPVNAVPES